MYIQYMYIQLYILYIIYAYTICSSQTLRYHFSVLWDNMFTGFMTFVILILLLVYLVCESLKQRIHFILINAGGGKKCLLNEWVIFLLYIFNLFPPQVRHSVSQVSCAKQTCSVVSVKLRPVYSFLLV